MGMVTAGTLQIASSQESGWAVAAFPDVCFTPTPAGPIPMAYPTGSVSAVKSAPAGSKAPIAGKTVVNESGVMRDAAGPKLNFVLSGSPTVVCELGMTGLSGSPRLSNAAAQGPAAVAGSLRKNLSNLHAQILNLPGSDPRRWRSLLDAYVREAAKLYIALHFK